MHQGNQLELAGNQIEENRPPVDSLVISVQQPWAWAIIYGGKDVENRTWFTKVRGRVLIHAGLKLDMDGYHWIAANENRLTLALPPHYAFRRDTRPADQGTQLGGIIGSIEILGCTQRSTSRWAADGQYHFLLRNPQPLPFYPCRGQLGFFRI